MAFPLWSAGMVSKLVGFQVSNLHSIFFSSQRFHMINTNDFPRLLAMQICSSRFGDSVLSNIQNLQDFSPGPKRLHSTKYNREEREHFPFKLNSASLPTSDPKVQGIFTQLFFRDWEARGSSLPLNMFWRIA